MTYLVTADFREEFMPCDTAKEFGDRFHVQRACHLHFGARSNHSVYDIKRPVLPTEFHTL